jgi:hypothetical protein
MLRFRPVFNFELLCALENTVVVTGIFLPQGRATIIVSRFPIGVPKSSSMLA